MLTRPQRGLLSGHAGRPRLLRHLCSSQVRISRLLHAALEADDQLGSVPIITSFAVQTVCQVVRLLELRARFPTADPCAGSSSPSPSP